MRSTLTKEPRLGASGHYRSERATKPHVPFVGHRVSQGKGFMCAGGGYGIASRGSSFRPGRKSDAGSSDIPERWPSEPLCLQDSRALAHDLMEPTRERRLTKTPISTPTTPAPPYARPRNQCGTSSTSVVAAIHTPNAIGTKTIHQRPAIAPMTRPTASVATKITDQSSVLGGPPLTFVGCSRSGDIPVSAGPRKFGRRDPAPVPVRAQTVG